MPYFEGLDSPELDSISRFVFEKRAERGEIILSEGESSEAWYFVASGAVKAFKTSTEGKEQILQVMRPGESFNDVPALDSGPNLASAMAMGPVTLYGINRSHIEPILRDHPQIALNVNKILASKLRHLASIIEDLSFKPVIGRVAKILLEQAKDTTWTGPRLTQQEMAAMAGTVREVVGRSLKTLEDEGVIKLERNRLVINDTEALKDLVETFQ